MAEILRLNLPAPPKSAAIEKRDGSLENPAVPLNWPVELEMDGLFGPTSDAGVRVSELIAMQLDVVAACVRVRAEAMGQMPMEVFEKTKMNGEPANKLADELPLFDLLHSQPNPFMTSVVWCETMSACEDIHGNAYAIIERDNATRPIALWPVNPKKMKPFVVKYDDPRKPDELWYCQETGEGNRQGKMVWWEAADVIHFVGMGFDGLVGLSPIKYFMKNALGLAMAAEKYGARFYANNGRPGGILIYKGTKLDQTQKENIKNSWQEAQAGRNQGRPAVLTGDWDWKEMNIPAEEMQFIQTRKLQDEKICGFFRVPPHKVGILERSTNNNIEHQSIEFVRDCLGPKIRKWQMELTNKLFPVAQVGRSAGRKFFVKFDSSELVMGDYKTTMDALSVALLDGSISVNEARRKLSMNPIGPEGDQHTVQSQLTTLENLAQQAEVGKASAKFQIDNIAKGILPGQQPPQPGGEGGEQPPKPGEGRYSALFTDAFHRVCTREKRDSDVITKVFAPVISTIASDLNNEAMTEFRAAGLPTEALAKIATDQMTAMSKRAADWKDQDADELAKTYRALRVTIFKEIAVQKAKE